MQTCFLLTFVWAISGVVDTDRTRATVKRYHYGVVFTYAGSTEPKSSYWAHTFQFSLPSMTDWKPVEHWCQSSIYAKMCKEYKFLIDLAVEFANHTQQQFNNTLQATYDLLVDSKLPLTMVKSKRSLLPFIGKLSKSLFGTATQEDVQLVASHVQAISQSQSQLLAAFQTHVEHTSSFMALTQKKFANFEAILQQQYADLVESIIGQQQWIKQHEENFALLLHRMFSKLYDYVLLNNQLQQLYNAIELLNSGFIPASLVSTTTLKDTISDIQKMLNQKFPNLRLLYPEPTFYYKYHGFLVLRNGSDVYITIKFPLTSHIKEIEVYKVTTFPVPFFNDSSFLTILKTPVKYLLVTHDPDYFMEIEREIPAIDQFSVEQTSFRRSPSCLYAMFAHLNKDFKSICPFHVIEDNKEDTGLIVLDYPNVLLRHVKQYYVITPKETITKPGSKHGITTVPCGASLRTESHYLPPSISSCSLNIGEPTSALPKHPVNLALLTHFFDNETLSDFSTDQLLDYQLQVKLPPMKFFNHEFEDKLAVSKQLTYQLDKVVNASKADEKIFKSMIDPLLTGDVLVPSEFFLTPPGYLSIATAITTLINFLLILWLAYKMKLLAAAITGFVSHTPRIAARTMPSVLIASAPPTSEAPGFTATDYNLPPGVIEYLVLFLLLCYFGKKLWLWRSKKVSFTTAFEVYLEVKANNKCSAIKLLSVAGCPADYVVTGTSLCKNVRLEGLLCPKMHLQWDDFQLVNKHTNKTLMLPNQCTVSWLERVKLSSLIANEYVCLLFFLHGGQSFYMTM